MKKDLKFLLLKKLKALKETIENYQFNGSDRIEDEIENIFGSIALNRDKITTEQEKNTVQRVFEFLGRLSRVITTASAAKNLLPDDINIIEIGRNLLP